jgi:hypothetical protein
MVREAASRLLTMRVSDLIPRRMRVSDLILRKREAPSRRM